ncbi:MAG: S46 family peptidase, partial [Bacteroidales bacterium]|nr:S46 family peptidase [Bacteroidales bacterium]
ESLASDVSFTPDYNKCVCVDIRYVLWILEDYVGLERIVKEIE